MPLAPLGWYQTFLLILKKLLCFVVFKIKPSDTMTEQRDPLWRPLADDMLARWALHFPLSVWNSHPVAPFCLLHQFKHSPCDIISGASNPSWFTSFPYLSRQIPSFHPEGTSYYLLRFTRLQTCQQICPLNFFLMLLNILNNSRTI